MWRSFDVSLSVMKNCTLEIDPAELKATYERKLLKNGGVEGRPEIE